MGSSEGGKVSRKVLKNGRGEEDYRIHIPHPERFSEQNGPQTTLHLGRYHTDQIVSYWDEDCQVHREAYGIGQHIRPELA